MVLISRTIHFNAAHRLFRRDRSEEWNRATFGAAANPAGYGHNYGLEIAVAGEPDPEDGMVINLVELDRVLREEVDRPLDHRNLNLDVAPFDRLPPTAENLALWIRDRVAAALPAGIRLAHLRLQVTRDFRVDLGEPEIAGRL